jgi:hypothetical protein
MRAKSECGKLGGCEPSSNNGRQARRAIQHENLMKMEGLIGPKTATFRRHVFWMSLGFILIAQ